MPLYEYVCRQCAHPFEALVFGKDQPACPKCESADLEKQLSAFAVGAEASAAPARGAPACGAPMGSCGGAGGCPMRN